MIKLEKLRVIDTEEDTIKALKEQGIELNKELDTNDATFAMLEPTSSPTGSMVAEIKPVNSPIYHTTYEEDIHIEDKGEVLDLDWLKKNWQKGKVSHSSRFTNVARIIDKVKELDSSMAEKIQALLNKYDKDPKVFTYNDLKAKVFELFNENTEESKELTEEEKYELKKYASGIYNKEYKTDYKYKDLPRDWKDILDPYLESGKPKVFKKKVNELIGEKIEEKKKTPNEQNLKKDFEKEFGFEYSEENLKKFAYENEEDAKLMLACFKETLKAFEEKKISYDDAVGFFKIVSLFPSRFQEACALWYKPGHIKGEEAPTSELKTLKEVFEGKVEEIKRYGDKYYIESIQEEHDYYIDQFKRGTITKKECLEEMIKEADNILADIEEEKKEKGESFQEKVDKENSQIAELVRNAGATSGSLDDALKKIFHEVKDDDEGAAKLRKYLIGTFKKHEDAITKLDTLPEDDIIKIIKDNFKENKEITLEVIDKFYK